MISISVQGKHNNKTNPFWKAQIIIIHLPSINKSQLQRKQPGELLIKSTNNWNFMPWNLLFLILFKILSYMNFIAYMYILDML